MRRRRNHTPRRRHPLTFEQQIELADAEARAVREMVAILDRHRPRWAGVLALLLIPNHLTARAVLAHHWRLESWRCRFLEVLRARARDDESMEDRPADG